MTIELPNLPYACEAPEPLISGATQRTRHGTHHRRYVGVGDTSMLADVAAVNNPIRGRAGKAATAE